MPAAPKDADPGRPRADRGPRVESVEAMRETVREAVARAAVAAPPARPLGVGDPYGHLANPAQRAAAAILPATRPHAEDLPPRIFDPRETEDWFLRLPPDRQREIRAYWQADAERGAHWVSTRRRARRRAAFDTGLILAGVWGLATVWSAGSLLGFVTAVAFAFAIGAIAGAVVHWCNGGRFAAAAAGILAWIGVAVFQGTVGAASGSSSIGFFFLLGMWLNAQMFAAWGLHREFGED